MGEMAFDNKRSLITGGLTAVVCSSILIGVYNGLKPEHELTSATPSVANVRQTKVADVPSVKSGLDSPYRYNCDEVDCTPLDDYVWRDNKDFRYEQIAEYGNLIGLRPVKSFVFNMTSQNWLTERDVSRTEWYHELVVTLPKDIDPELNKSCIMLIDGGSNRPDYVIPEDNVAITASQAVAYATKSCVAILRQVPNQALYFKNDARKGESGRKEDEIIAWTWKHFIVYPNQPDWLLRMPMTKAARLALDLINIKIQEEKSKLGSVWKDQFADVVDEFTI